jgi:hypothetical protein
MSDRSLFQNDKPNYRCLKTFLVLCQTCKYSFPKTVFYSKQSRGNFRNRFDTALVGLILISTLMLSACGGVAQQAHPLIYGVWSAFGQPMTSLISLSQDGKSKIVIGTSSTGLNLLDFATKHNYSSPFSADGKYAAAYSQDSKGNWILSLMQTTAGSSAPVYQRTVGGSDSQLSRYIEGFSPSSRYFAYSIVDSNTGLMTVEVYDLQKKVLLNSLPSSYFIDFLPQNDSMVILSLGPTGKISGIQNVSLPDETQTSIFQPAQDEQIGALIVSPDGKYLYYTETSSASVYRRPVAGGDRQLVYQFKNVDQYNINFDEYGHYLKLITYTNKILSLVLIDTDLKQVLSISSIDSTTMAFSPNGQYMAFQKVDNDKTGLWMVDLQSKKYLDISDTGKSYLAQFTPDSQYLTYQEVTDSTNNVGDLHLLNLATNNNELIASNVTSYVINSGTLVYTQTDAGVTPLTTSIYTSSLAKANDTQLLRGPESGVLRFIQ